MIETVLSFAAGAILGAAAIYVGVMLYFHNNMRW